MYRNEDEFVRGQKIKIIITVVIMAVVLIHSYLTTGLLTATWWH